MNRAPTFKNVLRTYVINVQRTYAINVLRTYV